MTSPESNKKRKKTRHSSDHKPCARCKAQHLKCTFPPDATVCQRCQRAGHECIQMSKKFRFRDVPAAKFGKVGIGHPDHHLDFDESFVNDSIVSRSIPTGNAEASRTDPIVFATQLSTNYNAELKNLNVERIQNDTTNQQPQLEGGGNFNSQGSAPSEARLTQLSSHATLESYNVRRGDSMHSEVLSPLSVSGMTPLSQNGIFQQESATLLRKPRDSFGTSPHSSLGATIQPLYLAAMVKAPRSATIYGTQTYLETILLRYFHEELAPWFDICDPFQHFASILPRRAREHGPLRNALLTISARNLANNQMFRTPTGLVRWKGHDLPDLTEELAISYHNECIRELLRLSLDRENLCDEALLAAVVVLRTDEEMLHEDEDKQLFLRISSLFIDAQLPSHLALPRTSPQISYTALEAGSPDSNVSPAIAESHSGGLRQACFWTALRQDLHAAFLTQQSVKFPLTRCESFRQLTVASDAVWANRMVVLCADVLEFCYGSESIDAKVLPAYTDADRWHQLQSHKTKLLALLPASFEPLYCREPNAGLETFPSLFYLEPLHVSGTTYIELATMLLEVYDPARPKLGHGCLRATRAFVASTKKTLFRLCGIALSNCDVCPPSLVNASLGIALFGEYVEDTKERHALMEVLSLMIQRYNYYPTAQIARSLGSAWSSEGDMEMDMNVGNDTNVT